MNELVQAFPYLAQVPIVLLVIWLNRQHKRDQDEARERYLSYMAERDKQWAERDKQWSAVLAENSATQRMIASQIAALTKVITRLDARLRG